MRVNINLLWVLAAFFVLADVVYTGWAMLTYDGRVEWVGTVGIGLVALMSIFIGFYLNRSFHAQGGPLPEDRLDASIDDGDPELGHFSPWSWWPIILATAATLGFLGFAVGTWIAFIGFAVFIIAIVGWVYEYYRGYFAH
ncbi:cytochrome c oxidase subunit 4 [Amnibacterium kyonggiense]|uniref:Cytochrome c oxidase polypeptide 4 n=1 Tax=Amnibacterium kyonggiense TaxID=595671 RepID=A0A4V3EAL2_9MICO|nr:cytochrome c oxidase subunit 4 [Amnibacterium kyonggiense]TDS77044.1 cytochrome c oxidase subunit IV [Amnibacterium kyonggiense]